MKTELSGHGVSRKFFKRIVIQEIAFMILNSVFLYVSWRKEINVKRFLKLVMIFMISPKLVISPKINDFKHSRYLPESSF